MSAKTNDLVLSLRELHEATWRDKPESYWLARLMQEVGELGSSLVGDHDDPADWELAQIAAICLNWLDMRAMNGEELSLAFVSAKMLRLLDEPEAS
jgi:hypothetical protein